MLLAAGLFSGQLLAGWAVLQPRLQFLPFRSRRVFPPLLLWACRENHSTLSSGHVSPQSPPTFLVCTAKNVEVAVEEMASVCPPAFPKHSYRVPSPWPSRSWSVRCLPVLRGKISCGGKTPIWLQQDSFDTLLLYLLSHFRRNSNPTLQHIQPTPSSSPEAGPWRSGLNCSEARKLEARPAIPLGLDYFIGEIA